MMGKNAVIGYTRNVQGNTWIYDLNGRFVSISEPGLGSPLIDPTDLVFVVGLLGKVGIRGIWWSGREVAANIGLRAAERALSESDISLLRLAFRRLVQRKIRFSKTTALRMEDPNRFVPVNILKLALRYGERDLDPESATGAFRYRIVMYRGSKKINTRAKKFLLHVVVDERSWTILHFHYEETP